jgi:hypothetical protein
MYLIKHGIRKGNLMKNIFSIDYYTILNIVFLLYFKEIQF